MSKPRKGLRPGGLRPESLRPETAEHHITLWITACHDLGTALYLAKNPEMTTNTIGFHVQQAVEKAVKAYLSKAHVSYSFTHDLTNLIDLLQDHTKMPTKFDELKILTPFAVSFRYELPIPPEDFNTSAAIDLAREFCEWVSAIGGF